MMSDHSVLVTENCTIKLCVCLSVCLFVWASESDFCNDFFFRRVIHDVILMSAVNSNESCDVIGEKSSSSPHFFHSIIGIPGELEITREANDVEERSTIFIKSAALCDAMCLLFVVD